MYMLKYTWYLLHADVSESSRDETLIIVEAR